MTVKRLPQFELCEGEEEGTSSFYLFPDPFNFHFYNRMCDNLGGLMPMPVNNMDMLTFFYKFIYFNKISNEFGGNII